MRFASYETRVRSVWWEDLAEEEWHHCRTSQTGAALWKASICTCCNFICLLHIFNPPESRNRDSALAAVSRWTTGRGLSAYSRHHGNALWRKTAEHHLRLLTRLQRPLRPPTAESGAARHVWARTSDDAQWHHVYSEYSRSQMSTMMNPLIHPLS